MGKQLFKDKLSAYRIQNYRFTFVFRLIFLIVISMAIGYLVLYLQPTSFDLVKEMSEESGYYMPFLNILPIFLFLTILYYVFGNLNVASSCTYFVFVSLSFLNRYKIIYRDDPVIPADFALGKEAMNITQGTGYSVETKVVFWIITLFLFLNIIVYFVNLPKPKKIFRFFIPIVLLGVSFFTFTSVYESDEVWKELPMPKSVYNLTENYNHKGVVYCFLHFMNANEVTKPKAYDKSVVEKFINENTVVVNKNPEKKQKMPNIVMIMGEAFADISRCGAFKFDSPEDDPLKHFKEVEKESIVSGYITVSSFGGGTANTEYDVLTGNVTTFLNPTTISSFMTVRKPVETIVRVLKGAGYESVGVHPGSPWFYNRENVYRHFGFDKVVFEDDFQNPNHYGFFITEVDTTKKLFELYKSADKSKSLFEYCVTIQNHGSYPNEKYGDRPINKNFTTDVELNDEMRDSFAVYFEGVRDMDIQIGELTDYFRNLDEPVIFIYYGDHLPYLTPEKASLKAVKYGVTDDIEGLQMTYKTPYVVWCNKAARPMLDSDFVDSLDKFNRKTINASYVGAMLLGLLDLDEVNPFYKFINEVRVTLPVAQRDFLAVFDGSDTKLLYPDAIEDEKTSRLYKFYKDYVYYNMKK